MKIHREGFRILSAVFFLFVALWTIFWFALGLTPLIILLIITIPFYIFILRFFRVPNRIVKPDLQSVLSPCDGTIVAIEEVEESEFLKKRCIQISVFMSVWNVHINWYPIDGQVVYQKYHPGKFLVAWHPKSSTLNERTSIAVEHPSGSTILFRQIAGFLARRIICSSQQGDFAKQGMPMGFIKFGSRVDVFVPINSKVEVELNQKVIGTQTILASLQE